jgi:hypothetical protein
LALLVLVIGVEPAQAQTPDKSAESLRADVEPVDLAPPAGAVIADYRSKHFLVHTDLAREDAEALLERLEATLGGVAKYWGRPCRAPIECYVAKDLAAWPDSALPNPLARLLIGGVGGATVVRSQRVGKRLTHTPAVYASDRPGIAEHESVHAYCTLAFGLAGPDWYREGMADRAYYHRHGERDVQLPADVLTSLKQGQPRTLHEIVNKGRFTGALSKSVDSLLVKHELLQQGQSQDERRKNVPLEAWQPEHAADVKTARESYLWSWALCHLLCENPNYADRFRALGQGYLTGRQATFEQAFGLMEREICFEYDLFLKHVEQGYRVDLCVWDWNKPSVSAGERAAVVASVHAARGYQASGLKVGAGEEVAYQATGHWTLSNGGDAVSADGDTERQGRLVGVLLDQYKLGEPFELGARGTFKAPGAGTLYLRCLNAWNSLADNHGAISVRFSRP